MRCKFCLQSIQKYYDNVGNQTGETVKLVAVYDDDPESENAQWSKYTPSGEFEFTVTNPGAFGKINNGEFFIDIIPVED